MTTTDRENTALEPVERTINVPLLRKGIAEQLALDENGCWLWTGYVNQTYPIARFNGKMRSVHRGVYELLVGPVLDGMTLDHTCRQPRCSNPAHLEIVSARENILRGTGPAAVNARKTSCKFGHPYSPENTMRTGQGRRRCKVCAQRWQVENRARRVAASHA